MSKIKELLKQNAFLVSIVRGLRGTKNGIFRLLNKALFHRLPLGSSRWCSPKGELRSFEDITKYVEEGKKKGKSTNAWHFYKGELSINPPKQTIGIPEKGSELEERKKVTTDEFLFLLPKVRVYQRDYALVTEDGLLLAPISNVYSPAPLSHPIFNKVRLPKTHYLKGTSLILFGGMGYYHGMLDALPILHLIELAGFRVEDIAYFIVLDLTETNYSQLFKRAGIPREKMINLKDAFDNYECEEVLISSFFNRRGQWMKDYLLSKLNIQKIETEYPKKLYISRRNTIMRRALNEDSVVSLLEKYGYTTVYNEKMSIDEQVAMYAQATHIVSIHGANLVNIIFCQPSTKLCEIRYAKHQRFRNTYYELASVFGLDYYLLYCTKGKSVINNYGVEDVPDSDVYIEDADLEKIVQAMELS